MKTIAVSEEVHQKIAEFGRKNETFNQILERLYESAIEVQYAKLLLDTKDTIAVRDLKW
jgi:predicted CopG family antitoxin